MSLPRNLVILGSGAMGSLLAAMTHAVPGWRVRMVAHWNSQRETVARDGLLLEHMDDRTSRHAIAVSDRIDDLPPADAVIVVVKGHRSERAAEDASALLRADGIALSLQNGIGALAVLADRLGPERVASGVTFQAARMVAPGRVAHTGAGVTYLPAGHPRAERIAALRDLLTTAGWPCELDPDIDTRIWEKLVINSAVNPLTALGGIVNGALPAHPVLWPLARAVAEETAGVARAAGIRMDAQTAARLAAVCRATAPNRSSMLQDLDRGALTEVAAINGAVAAAARAAGRSAPLNTFLTAAIREREAGRTVPLERLAALLNRREVQT